jgi:hypothetical protein
MKQEQKPETSLEKRSTNDHLLELALLKLFILIIMALMVVIFTALPVNASPRLEESFTLPSTAASPHQTEDSGFVSFSGESSKLLLHALTAQNQAPVIAPSLKFSLEEHGQVQAGITVRLPF